MKLIDADAKEKYLLDGRYWIEPTKHGRWIHYLKKGLKWECSECGSRYATPWHYCPNCGARMDGGENG